LNSKKSDNPRKGEQLAVRADSGHPESPSVNSVSVPVLIEPAVLVPFVQKSSPEPEIVEEMTTEGSLKVKLPGFDLAVALVRKIHRRRSL
jgi:hypothetical protein